MDIQAYWQMDRWTDRWTNKHSETSITPTLLCRRDITAFSNANSDAVNIMEYDFASRKYSEKRKKSQFCFKRLNTFNDIT